MTIRETAGARRAALFGRRPRATRELDAGAAVPPRDARGAPSRRAASMPPPRGARPGSSSAATPQIAEAWRDQRSLPFLDTLRQDVRYGVRMLRRTPASPPPRSLTLTLGIGANTAIFTVVDAVLLRPLPYARARSARHRRRSHARRASRRNVGFATVARLARAEPQLRAARDDALAGSRRSSSTAKRERAAGRARQLELLRHDRRRVPRSAAASRADDDRPDHWRVLLLSDGLWRRRFGADPSIVGRTDRDERSRVPRHRRDAARRSSRSTPALLQRRAPRSGRRSATT